MAFNPRAREPFDPSRAFVIVRPVRVGGKTYGAKQPFDKTLVTTRKLRQLYDGRYLAMAPSSSPAFPPASPPSVYNYSESELVDWLTARGVVPRQRDKKDRKKLLAMVEETLAGPLRALAS